jgi:hypothetical protein
MTTISEQSSPSKSKGTSHRHNAQLSHKVGVNPTEANPSGLTSHKLVIHPMPTSFLPPGNFHLLDSKRDSQPL